MSDEQAQPEQGAAPIDAPLKLYGKLLKIRKELGPIVKSGEGDGYLYTRAEDVLKTVVEKMDEHELLVLPAASGVHRRSNETVTTVALFYDVVDAASGESRVFEWRGSGEDKAEKGLYQGYTGGLKYFLLNLFMLPTFDDPELKAGGQSADRPQLRDVSASKLPDQEREQLAAVLEALGVAEGDLNEVDTWARSLTQTDYSRWMELLTDAGSAEQTSAIIVATAHGYRQGASAA